MARIAFSDVLKVRMSTYCGNLDDSEGIHDFMAQDLHDISDSDNWRVEGNVKCKMLDGTEKVLKEKDLEDDYSVNRDIFRKEVISRSESEINGSIMMASGHKFKDIKELLTAYGMEFNEWKWYMPQYYNYEHDTLDIGYDSVDKDWSLEKYGLTELVQEYIDSIRIESYDGYCSFEPKNIDDVKWNDYCVMWSILQKEGVFDSIKNDLQEMADYQGYEIYQEAVESQHYYWREDTMPDKGDGYFSDRYKLHYFLLDCDEKCLEEVPYEYLYPKKIEMVDKEKIEKIFNYMDGVYLVNAEEVLSIAQDAYAYAVYGDTDKQLSRREVVESEKIAQEYIERKGMKFDEEGDII